MRSPRRGMTPAQRPSFSSELGLGPQEEEADGKQILQGGQGLGSGQGPALHTWLRCEPAPGRERDIPIPTDQGAALGPLTWKYWEPLGPY